jgi:hypothetical protein
MTSAVPLPPAGSEFDEFLYASIGEEGSGMLVSVLSALARLNVDPWDEASRLARLPHDAAVRFLAAMIEGLPDGTSARSDSQTHAMRLVALLPKRADSNRQSTNPMSSKFTGDRRGLIRYVIVSMVLMIFLLVSQWLIERLPAAGSSGAAPPATTGTTLPPTR